MNEDPHGRFCSCESCTRNKQKLSSWRAPPPPAETTYLCCYKCKQIVGVVGYTLVDSMVLYCVPCAVELKMVHDRSTG